MLQALGKVGIIIIITIHSKLRSVLVQMICMESW